MSGVEVTGRRIVLTGLRVEAWVGWTEPERAVPQLVVLDLELSLAVRPGEDAGTLGDELTGTVDYADLAGRVAAVVVAAPRRLIETVAAEVLAEILSDRRVDAATVTVHKPHAPMPVAVDDVAVVVEGRSGPG